MLPDKAGLRQASREGHRWVAGVRWMSEFCVHALMCWGWWVYSTGRERCRKWLEIADALRGLQKINSSQEESHNPQPAFPLAASPCSLLVIYLLKSPIPFQYRHLLCTSNAVLLWGLCIPRGRSRHFQRIRIGWKRSG